MLRGKITISADAVIEKPHCWDDDYIRKWAMDRFGVEECDYADVVESDMSVADKLWVTWNFPVFNSTEMHELAIAFAEHWLDGSEPEAEKLLVIKRLWVAGRIGNDFLASSQRKAWDEAKIFPTTASTAFALARDPFFAVQGAYARAGGAYGPDINVEEKLWQWGVVMKKLEQKYGEVG